MLLIYCIVGKMFNSKIVFKHFFYDINKCVFKNLLIVFWYLNTKQLK